MDWANMDLNRVQMAITLLVGGAAVIEDLARRTISNWTSLAALAAGLVCQSLAGGWRGAGSALLGAIVGFAAFYIVHVLGGRGGGDVKLMAGLGAVVGIGQLLMALIWVSLTGGVIALGVLGWSAAAKIVRPSRAGAVMAIPYAPAIVGGVWLTLLGNQ
ncbi:MAG: prepilin peptidase [Acidobacteria bacterium]|nr:prepilin peptidase [Acidobacteriota bacterium]